MKKYQVELFEKTDDDFTILFECWADDLDHAEEQALNAYPECEFCHTQEIE